MSERLRRRMVRGTAIAVALTGVIAAAHLPAARPLLRKLGAVAHIQGACPLGYDRVAGPQDREAAREKFAAAHAGSTAAAARPALGFELDGTTRTAVLAWASAHGVRCEKPSSGSDLECKDVSEALLPVEFRGAGLDTLWMEFGKGEKLISVVALRRDKKAKVISEAFGKITGALAQQVGPPADTQGDPSAARLAKGLLNQASAEFRFGNYYALARETNMGDSYLLTEEYRSLRE